MPDNNISIDFSSDFVIVKAIQSGKILFQGHTTNLIYEWLPSKSFISATLDTTCVFTPLDWHHKLGHPSISIFKQISSLFSLAISRALQCNACDFNSHKLHFYSYTMTSKGRPDVTYSDVRTSPIHSFDGYKYYIIFVDHFSKYLWLYPLKHKSKKKKIIHEVQILCKQVFKRPIITFTQINMGAHVKIVSFLASNGITPPPLAPLTHLNIMVIPRDVTVT